MKNIVVFAANECSKEKEDYYYQMAAALGRLLAKNGFTVITGGGPGLMNEVMRAAYKAGGKTIAVCLDVPGRPQTEFASEKIIYTDLTARQTKLISLGDAFVSLPGGLGTFYEISAILAHKRKKEINPKTPFVLVDGYFREYETLIGKMVQEGFTGKEVYEYYRHADSPEDAIRMLKKSI